MGRRLVQTLVISAILAVAVIIATQVYWLNQAVEIQQSQLALRKAQQEAENKQFNDRVTMALTGVTNELLTINNDPAELFQAVKQVRPNFFTVAINDTVHPYLLERLLRTEFQQRNIDENFEYGVYDCFTDSIVYGDYVALNGEDAGKPSTTTPAIKWDKDGHYFSVFFPDRELQNLPEKPTGISIWAFSAVISLVVFSFFAYAVFLVVRQKRLSEMKTDFINNMTHELKTPISTISLSSEILLKDTICQQPGRLKEYAQLIYNENHRLKLQVDKVLQLATLDKEQIKLGKTRVDMHRIIHQALQTLDLVKGSDTLKLEVNLQATAYLIAGDEVHLSNIVNNLLDNAQKYSDGVAEIRVSTRTVAQQFVLEVADKGIGIPAKALPYIFDKFYRVPTGNRHDVKGFGLGLYYVKQMVEAHGGKISVRSERSEGSTFTVTLPLLKRAK